MTAVVTSLSSAAIHEAAHELVALNYGCRDVHALVRGPERGVCYFRLPASERWDDHAGEWREDDLAPVRARAAVSMAGGMAEAIFDGRDVPDFEELLIAESEDPALRTRGYEYGSLEEVFNHATSVFRDHRLAARWMTAALPGVHQKTHKILSENWSRLLRRAGELDQTLTRAA